MERKTKIKIRTKILLLVLGLPLISLFLFSYKINNDLRATGNFILQNSITLGSNAALESEKTLKEQSKSYLLRIVENQAAVSNAIFEKVELSVDILTDHASSLWDNQSQLQPGPSFYWDSEIDPNNPPLSVCRLALENNEGIEKDIDISSNIDNLFVSSLAHDPNIKILQIGTETGLHRRSPFTRKHKKGYDPRVRDWYKDAIKSDVAGWSEPYISATEELLMITCYKAVYNKNNELAGVLGADVILDVLNDKIINTQIGDLGYAFLMDQKGRIIVSPGSAKGDQKWDESFETESWLNHKNAALKNIAKDMTAGKTGIVQSRYNDEEKFIAYAPLKNTSWSLGIVMSVKEVISSAENTKNKINASTKVTEQQIKTHLKKFDLIFAIFLVVIMTIVSFLGIRLSKKITDPIILLNKGANIIGSGKLEHKLDIQTGDELESLSDAFNKMAENLKSYIKNLNTTTAEKEKIESELNIAKEIQMSLLPNIFPPFPDRKEFDIFADMNPAKEVGGDLYDFFFINERKLCFLIGDVSGKGVPAALFMVITKILLKTQALRGLSPSEILDNVNKIIYPENDENMFITVFCAIIDTVTGEVEYSNAGHNPPLIYTKGEDFTYLKMERSFVVGPMEDTNYVTRKIQLNPNDMIFLYTDGVTEATNKDLELFNEARLQEALSKIEDVNPENVIAEVKSQVNKFVGEAEQSDDITMLALRYKG
ncbi:MAG: SpoIIE family protein phosphatase, partial [Waddliaceae bacterium]|nr:SpoIIE family protein phosphatase [Waddliaceae bacterium]